MPIVKNHKYPKMQAIELEQPLWRYMDFAQFMALLVTETLHLTRIDMFDDAWEGFVPRLEKVGGFFEDQILSDNRELRAQAQGERKRFCATCWHANDGHSDAMWKLYLKGSHGIAIRTTFRRLKESLERTPEHIIASWVDYYDETRNPPFVPGMLHACLKKRKCFEHEKEVRLIWEAPQGKTVDCDGINVKCEIRALIDEILLFPTGPKWFEDLVRKICGENDGYHILAEIRRNESEPTWDD